MCHHPPLSNNSSDCLSCLARSKMWRLRALLSNCGTQVNRPELDFCEWLQCLRLLSLRSSLWYWDLSFMGSSVNKSVRAWASRSGGLEKLNWTAVVTEAGHILYSPWCWEDLDQGQGPILRSSQWLDACCQGKGHWSGPHNPNFLRGLSRWDVLQLGQWVFQSREGNLGGCTIAFTIENKMRKFMASACQTVIPWYLLVIVIIILTFLHSPDYCLMVYLLFIGYYLLIVPSLEDRDFKSFAALWSVINQSLEHSRLSVHTRWGDDVLWLILFASMRVCVCP